MLPFWGHYVYSLVSKRYFKLFSPAAPKYQSNKAHAFNTRTFQAWFRSKMHVLMWDFIVLERFSKFLDCDVFNHNWYTVHVILWGFYTCTCIFYVFVSVGAETSNYRTFSYAAQYTYLHRVHIDSFNIAHASTPILGRWTAKRLLHAVKQSITLVNFLWILGLPRFIPVNECRHPPSHEALRRSNPATPLP